jgi:hypothetical protein
MFIIWDDCLRLFMQWHNGTQSRWTENEFHATRFIDERSALAFVSNQLNGKGQVLRARSRWEAPHARDLMGIA